MNVTSARAGMVFQDNFNRTGALHGSMPSFTTGGTWTATAGFFTDGTRVGASFGLFDDFTSAAYVPLPVAITSGNIYTLSATMHKGPSTDNSAVMMFGFFDAAPSWNATAIVDEGNAIAVGPRNNIAAVSNVLDGFVGSNIPVVDGTNGVTYGVRLYETAPNVWEAVAVELTPTNQMISLPTSISLSRIANIHTIGMISGSLLPPYLDNFTLDVSPVSTSAVPEPSTFALGFASLAGLGLVKRRKKKVLQA